jgi:ATP-dependent Lon protease
MMGEAEQQVVEIPVLALRDTIVFPEATAPLTVGRPASRHLLSELPADRRVLLVLQRDPAKEDPGVNDVHPIGVIALILKTADFDGDGQAVALARGVQRARIVSETHRLPYLRVRALPLTDRVPAVLDAEFRAMADNVRDLCAQVVLMSPVLSNDLLQALHGLEEPAALSDVVASILPSLSRAGRQGLLETVDVRARLELLTDELLRERESLALRTRLQAEAQQRLGEDQRKFFLREQLQAIRRELGEDEDDHDLSDLRDRLEGAQLPPKVKEEARRELGRLAHLPTAAPDHGLIRTYLDSLLALPWNSLSDGVIDIERAQRILDEDHHDLEPIKERILEYLAVMRLTRAHRGPILCFVGPPGVGKTSLGRSIARALDRPFVRMSLAGLHDEAELRGHRRTYVGALPGQIMQNLRRAGTRDPVFMLDEIDKIGRDFRGDPAAALLEVLDPEQNDAFRDHYFDVPFDLSRVLFVATANVLEPVSPTLRDRMEVLELAGYTEGEKLEIARRYLAPRQAREHGLTLGEDLTFTDEALRELIRGYTREAGVRNLERELGALCRKRAREVAAGRGRSWLVTAAAARARLGLPRFEVESEVAERVRRPGVAVALAWTPEGGDILFIEAARMPRDRGEVTMTGQLGGVMRESFQAALSWMRAHAAALDLDPELFRRFEIHVHVPAGAVPKDGPSAGLVMATALVSSFLQQPVRPWVAASGEITLGGHVLPVGGLKEKILAARRSGLREVILPAKNRAGVEQDLPAELREGIVFHFVSSIDAALAHAFDAPVLRVEEAPGSPAAAGPSPRDLE